METTKELINPSQSLNQIAPVMADMITNNQILDNVRNYNLIK